MSAEADDLRFFYSSVVGRTETIAAVAASSTKVAEPLSPGRYVVHFTALSAVGAIVWVKQGPFGSVVAEQSAPSTPLSLDGLRFLEFTVRPGPMSTPAAEKESSSWDGIAVRMSATHTANVHVTKISRDAR